MPMKGRSAAPSKVGVNCNRCVVSVVLYLFGFFDGVRDPCSLVERDGSGVTLVTIFLPLRENRARGTYSSRVLWSCFALWQGKQGDTVFLSLWEDLAASKNKGGTQGEGEGRQTLHRDPAPCIMTYADK